MELTRQNFACLAKNATKGIAFSNSGAEETLYSANKSIFLRDHNPNLTDNVFEQISETLGQVEKSRNSELNLHLTYCPVSRRFDIRLGSTMATFLSKMSTKILEPKIYLSGSCLLRNDTITRFTRKFPFSFSVGSDYLVTTEDLGDSAGVNFVEVPPTFVIINYSILLRWTDVVAAPTSSIYLLKNALRKIYLTIEPSLKSETKQVCFTVKDSQLVSHPHLKCDHEVSKVLWDAIHGTQNGCFEIHAKHSSADQKITIKIESSMDNFLQKISSRLLDPKLSFYGEFSLLNEEQAFLQKSAFNLSVDLDSKTTEPFQIATFFAEKAAKTVVWLRYSVFLEWEDVRMSLDIKPLYVMHTLNRFEDCWIVARNGSEVACHQNILGAHSDVLWAMMAKPGFGKLTGNKIEMRNVSETAVKTLLAYLYGGEVDTRNLKEETTFELLYTAYKYDITRLENFLIELQFEKCLEDFSMDYVLDLYFFVKNITDKRYQQLCKKLMVYLKRNHSLLQSSEFFQVVVEKHPMKAAELTFELILEVMNNNHKQRCWIQP